MEPLQIVLDTNVLVSGLRSKRGASYRVLSLLDSGAFEINLSVPLVLEYESVLLRHREQIGLSQKGVKKAVDYLCRVGNKRSIHFTWRPTLPDPADEMVLDVAVESRCQHIVTYNKRDFLGVERFGIHVVDARDFLLILEARP